MIDDVEVQPAVEQPTAQPTQVDNRAYNFREVERRALEAERALAEERAMRLSSQPVVEDDEDYVQVKTHKQTKAELIAANEKIEELNKKFDTFVNVTAQENLQSKHSDFHSIVNEDNMTKLAKVKPALYNSIYYNPSSREKGEALYDAISSYVMPTTVNEKKIEENKAKPKSLASVGGQSGDNPLSRLGQYDRKNPSPDRRKELQARMLEARKNR